tara:strand:+ start:180 stop:572 length:393 start_codon:yes stop_codon:yes gene_type:complete
MTRQIIGFYVLLITILAPCFLIHQKLYNAFLLTESYIYNALIACVVVTLVVLFQKRHKDYIAFYFFLGTTIKFLVFFMVVYPQYKKDGDQLENVLLIAFFLPYFLTLVIETTALVYLINTRSESNKSFKK